MVRGNGEETITDLSTYSGDFFLSFPRFVIGNPENKNGNDFIHEVTRRTTKNGMDV